jgi:hypothetical protein
VSISVVDLPLSGQVLTAPPAFPRGGWLPGRWHAKLVLLASMLAIGRGKLAEFERALRTPAIVYAQELGAVPF